MDVTTESAVTTTTSDVSVNLTSERTLKILYYCIGAFGLLGNSVILLALGTSRSLRKHRTNILIMNQSSIDFFCALFLILTNALEDEMPYNDAYCGLWRTKLPLWAVLVSSTYSLLLITIDRYLAIVHAVWHMNNMTTKPLVVGIVCVWLVGPLYNIAYMVPTSKTRSGDGYCQVFYYFPSLTGQRAVGILTFVLQFLIPIVVLIFCYLRMVRTLWMRIAAANDTSKNNKKAPMRNVVKTLIMVSACFFVCWVFNQVFYLAFNLGASMDFTSSFYHFTVIAVFCNCCINPIVYLAQYRQFQKRLIQIFRRNRGDNNTITGSVLPTEGRGSYNTGK